MPPREQEPRNKDSKINVRLDDELRRRLDNIHRNHKTTDTSAVVALLESFCTAVEEAAAVRFPVTILMATKEQLQAAEDKDEFQSGQRKTDKPPKPPDKSQRHRGDGPHRQVS